ncbi:MAG: FecR domain-containing protein [Anaerotignum sp.]|nr:FecR domain-containing protein [Anaerotignum sp.]
MRLKKILTVLLTLAMVVCLLPATAYAANNTATTMRLEKVQGKVTVSNATGKAVSQTDNMKLYNGYKVKTGAKSYAWISLDNTKVAKVDANACVEVQKSGKSLTLYIHSGNMFFNVKDPLKSGETFHIKTSTMTTGIRGTSGCVSVVNARVTEINLLTGKLEIVTEHPVLGQKKTAVLLAGQSATSLIDWEAMAVSGEMTEIIIEALTTEDVCGNCAIEIAADPDLIARIEKEAPQLLPALIAALAETKLAADEAADDAKQGEIDAAADAQEFPEDVDPYFEEEESGGGGGGGSSATTPTVNEVSVDSWTNAGNANAAPGLKEQLEAVQSGQPAEISLTNNVTVPAGESIAVDNGEDVTLNLGTSTLTLEADPNNQQASSIVNDGNLTITNTQGYIIGSGMTPAVINNSVLTMDDGLIDASDFVGVENNGTFTMTGGEITAGSGVGVENNGTFIMSGGTIDANRGTCVENYSTFTMNGGTLADASYGIRNQGTVTLNSGATLKNLDTGVAHNVDSGTAVINGATFDAVSQIASNYGRETVVTQNSITLKNTDFFPYINNYYGTVNIAGGPIGAEGGGSGIYNYGGTVNISGGSHDIYGGIENMSGGGYPAVTNVASGAVLQVYDGIGIESDGEGEMYAQINLEGSIIAEGTAKGIIATDTELTMGENAIVKAKEEDNVIQISMLPEGYEIVYEDEYFMLAKEGTGSSIQTISDEAAFRSAVMAETATQNGGALKLGADIMVTTEVTASAAKELNIDLQGYKLTFDCTATNAGKLLNTGKLRFVDSLGGGEIVINGNGDMAAIANSGDLVINEGVISGASGTLILNSGTLMLNDGCNITVNGDYGVYNTGTLILNMADGNDATLVVNSGIGIYSGGTGAALTLNSGYIAVYNNATGMKFNGGTVYLKGGKLKGFYTDGKCGQLIADSTAGSSAVEGAVGTALSVSAYSGGDNFIDVEIDTENGKETVTVQEPGDAPRDVAQYVYSGKLPEGYYIKYDNYNDEFVLQAYQDLEAVINEVYFFTGKPVMRDSNFDYIYENLILSFTEELKLAEDMTINAAAVEAAIGNVAASTDVLSMAMVTSDVGTLLIDLNGHTLTLDVPIEVYGKLKITDSVGGGKIVTGLDAWYTLNTDSEAGVPGTVSCSESLIEKTVAAQQEEEPAAQMENESEAQAEETGDTNEQEPSPAENGGEDSPEE